MNEACQRYAEDPEGNAAHLSECRTCREMYAMLDAPIDSQPVRVEALPLAAWEGAAYRARFDWRGLLQMATQAVRPLGPIGFSALFVAVNIVLILLLRRAPRGIDA